MLAAAVIFSYRNALIELTCTQWLRMVAQEFKAEKQFFSCYKCC